MAKALMKNDTEVTPDQANDAPSAAEELNDQALVDMDALDISREHERAVAQHARHDELLVRVKAELARVTEDRREYEARVRMAMQQERSDWSHAKIRDSLLIDENFKKLVVAERELEQERTRLKMEVGRWKRRAALISRTYELRGQEIELARNGYNVPSRRRRRR